MKKILGLTAGLCLLVASAAMACPKDGDQANASTKCMGAKSTSAASLTKGGGGSCEGMATANAGGCTMSSSECAAKMQHTKFSIQGLNSEEAASKVKMALANVKGVQEVTCDLEHCTATVCWKGAKVSSAVASKLNAAGYKTAVSQAHATCPHAAMKSTSVTKTKTT